jgi:hypothetical protein
MKTDKPASKYGPLGPWGDSDSMAVAAVRYCLGRRTYIVGECVQWLEQQWPNLSEGAQRNIRSDIESEFVRDDRVRTCGGDHQAFKPLGDECDRAEWEKARRLWA